MWLAVVALPAGCTRIEQTTEGDDVIRVEGRSVLADLAVVMLSLLSTIRRNDGYQELEASEVCFTSPSYLTIRPRSGRESVTRILKTS